MNNDDDKLKRLQQLMNIRSDSSSRNYARDVLDKDVHKVSGSSINPDVTPSVNRVKTGTDVIDTKEMGQIADVGEAAEQRALRSYKSDLKNTMKDAIERKDSRMIASLKQLAQSGDEGLMKALRNTGKIARTGLKQVPLIGGIAAAALGGAEDASAAIPILDSADSVGMSPEQENQLIRERQAQTDYQNSQAKKDRLAALAKLMKSGQ